MTGEQAVLLPVGADMYAVPVGWVREVVAAPPLTPLVTAPPLVLGLFNLRGQIVPLLDTAHLLGLNGSDPVAFAVVLQSPRGLVGLAATAFPQRATLGVSTGPSELPGTAGTYRVQRQIVVLLDPDALLASERLGAASSREDTTPSGVA
ncbi:MAG: purine-binding chemotaxis protein CheW [Actinomycetota bacterium]|jgi:chemotaxis signal transduction protein|nr:purine-binding chemotaxis protein CheW [Actinomycetota bacterium]